MRTAALILMVALIERQKHLFRLSLDGARDVEPPLPSTALEAQAVEGDGKLCAPATIRSVGAQIPYRIPPLIELAVLVSGPLSLLITSSIADGMGRHPGVGQGGSHQRIHLAVSINRRAGAAAKAPVLPVVASHTGLVYRQEELEKHVKADVPDTSNSITRPGKSMAHIWHK